MPIPSAAATFAAALTDFLGVFAAFRNEAALPDEISLAEAETTAAAIVARTARLNVWCAWIAVRREAEAFGLASIVASLEQGVVAPGASADAFRTAYCSWAAPLMIDQRAELRSFSAVSHEDLIQTFRQLDRELADITADYVHAIVAQTIPQKDAPNAPPGATSTRAGAPSTSKAR